MNLSMSLSMSLSMTGSRHKDGMANAENQELDALFGAECACQLDAMRGQLATLAGGVAASAPAASQLAAAHGLHDSLHTLAGAARAVDLLDLEYLLRALERLATPASGAMHGGRLPLFEAGIELAPQLLTAASGRVRNQMMALVARCSSAGVAP